MNNNEEYEIGCSYCCINVAETIYEIDGVNTHICFYCQLEIESYNKMVEEGRL